MVSKRKCVGCAEMKEKQCLLRVVRGAEGGFSLDLSGKAPGRGAYVCPNEKCLKAAQKRKGLERSFKSPRPKEVYDCLREVIENDAKD